MKRTLALLVLGAAPLHAQQVGGSIGYWFADTSQAIYQAGLSLRLLGPLGVDLDGIYLTGGSSRQDRWGGAVGLSLFRGARPGVYLVGGVAGGIEPSWSSWSAGLGYEFFPLRWLSLGAEGRWRKVSGGSDGPEVSLRIGFGGGSNQNPAPQSPPSTPAATPPDSVEVARTLTMAGEAPERAALLSAVVETAVQAMGTPYQWGGDRASGFDCSGLIQYAYGQHGVSLPRRSADQAGEGSPVAQSLNALLPGDILAFSNSGGPVTHVGLYVGSGNFIHSASGGVQISQLSPDDPAGRWWFARWVGARRVVE